MPRRRLSLFFLLCALGLPARTQETPDAPAAVAPAPAETAPAAVETASAPAAQDQPASSTDKPKDVGKPKDDWRDTTGYRYPSLASTVAAAQNMGYAMTLREYCADTKVPADFVRERLARFSRITGREESCQSLLDY
jgi:hypothetical protein